MPLTIFIPYTNIRSWVGRPKAPLIRGSACPKDRWHARFLMDMKSAARSQWAWDRGFPPHPPPTVPPFPVRGRQLGVLLLQCFYYITQVEGELAVPRSGRRSFRPIANFSRPRDSSHRLSSNIEVLGTLYHNGRENRTAGTAPRPETLSIIISNYLKTALLQLFLPIPLPNGGDKTMDLVRVFPPVGLHSTAHIHAAKASRGAATV